MQIGRLENGKSDENPVDLVSTHRDVTKVQFDGMVGDANLYANVISVSKHAAVTGWPWR